MKIRTGNLTKKIIVVCLSTVLTLSLFEGAAYLLNKNSPGAPFKFLRKKTGLKKSPHALKADGSMLDRSQAVFGTEFLADGLSMTKKNFSGRSIMKLTSGEILYDVLYNTDEFRRRLTPNQTGEKQSHAILIGDSWTFGQGVEDNETIASSYSESSPQAMTYNFGTNGYGIEDLYARIRFSGSDYWAGVKEEDGVAMYLFEYDQIKRLAGTMSYLGTWGAPHTYLQEDPSGQIKVMGSYLEAKPWRIKFFRFLADLEVVKAFGMDFPRITEDDWRFFAKISREIKASYLEHFPKGKFIFVLLPRLTDETTDLPKYLAEQGVDYVDYSENRLENLVGEKTYLNPDSHFTPAANKYLGRLLAQANDRLE